MPKKNPLFRPGWEMPYSDAANRVGGWAGQKLGSFAGRAARTGLAMIPFAGPAIEASGLGRGLEGATRGIGSFMGRVGGSALDTIAQLPLSVLDTFAPQLRGQKREGWWDPRTVAGPPATAPLSAPGAPVSTNPALEVQRVPGDEEIFGRSNVKYYHQPILK